MFSFRIGPARSIFATPALGTLLTLGSLALAPAFAQSNRPLDVHAAVNLAVGRSLALKAFEASSSASRDMAVVAGQRPDPVLRLSLDNLPVNGPDRWSTTRDFMTMRSVGVMQMLPSESKRQARSRRYEQQSLAFQSQREQQAAEVRRETAMAWLESRAADFRLTLMDRQIEESRQQVIAAEAAMRGAKGSQLEWIAARDALLILEQGRWQVAAEQAQARQALTRWTGSPPDQPLSDLPRLNVTALDTVSDGVAVDRNPELATLKARVDVARAAADVSRLDRAPDWSVDVMLSQRGPGFADMVSIGLSVPLPLNKAHRQDREWAASLAEVEALDSEWSELRRAKQLDIAAARLSWKAALAQLDVLDRERTPLAGQRLESALAAFRAGTSSLSVVLQARQAALMLGMERIDAELRAARLWAALEFLLPKDATTTTGR